VIKHAQATKGHVSVKQIGDQLVISVSDNGRGVKHGEVKDGEGLGLAGIAERARMLGGSSALESAPDKGTRLTVILNLAERVMARHRVIA
jgi:signal transduction histidine kinase